MIKFWQKRLKNNIVTENLELDKELEDIKRDIKNIVNKKFAGSLAIRMVDSGSCNACEAECNALSNPYYDLERLGIYFVASPRHADVMLVSGVMTFNMYNYVIDCYEQIASPKWVITVGDCPINKAPFKEIFAIKGPLENHLKVDYHIEGCPPSPKDILIGFLEFLKLIK